MSLEKVGLRIPGGEFGRDVCHSKCAPAGMVPEDPGGKARGLPDRESGRISAFMPTLRVRSEVL